MVSQHGRSIVLGGNECIAVSLSLRASSEVVVCFGLAANARFLASPDVGMVYAGNVAPRAAG